MTAQWDLSRILQKKLERYLAGLAITYPLDALQAFQELEEVMIDPVAIGWLKYLNLRKRDFLALDNERKIALTFALLYGFEDGKHLNDLISWLNETSLEYEPVSLENSSLVFSTYSPLFLISETERRIWDQHNFRAGLKDLTNFTVGYLT